MNEKRQLVLEKFSLLTDEQKQVLIDNSVIVTIDGKKLSDKNTAMLESQSKERGVNLKIVGGFNQWKSINRTIKKGEKCFYITVPRMKDDSVNGFGLASVFDISQTEEKE